MKKPKFTDRMKADALRQKMVHGFSVSRIARDSVKFWGVQISAQTIGDYLNKELPEFSEAVDSLATSYLAIDKLRSKGPEVAAMAIQIAHALKQVQNNVLEAGINASTVMADASRLAASASAKLIKDDGSIDTEQGQAAQAAIRLVNDAGVLPMRLLQMANEKVIRDDAPETQQALTGMAAIRQLVTIEKNNSR